MLVRSDRIEALASPAFIAALALLVVNDVALKPLLHNVLTGKLSDFAGLFALTLFAATLWPRYARLLGTLVGAAFTLWKTSYAEPLIAALNAVSPVAFGRVVDVTDLVALPMIPLAVWAAPRLEPWPLPKVLQLALVAVALVAFTATSRARYVARGTMDVTRQAAVDEPVLRGAFDEIAQERGLRCEVCVPLAEGRVYVPEGDSDVRALIVTLDRQTLNFTVSGYDRERGVRVLARHVRSEIAKRFPGVAVVDSSTGRSVEEPPEMTFVVVRASNGAELQRQKSTFSSIVGDVALAQGLEADPKTPLYHTGDGFEPEYSSLLVEPVLDEADMLIVRVTRRSSDRETLRRALNEQLASRLDAAFGAENVTQHDSPALEWTY